MDIMVTEMPETFHKRAQASTSEAEILYAQIKAVNELIGQVHKAIESIEKKQVCH